MRHDSRVESLSSIQEISRGTSWIRSNRVAENSELIAIWNHPESRQLFLSELVRTLSKLGTLEPYEESLSQLAEHLTSDEIVGLYAQLQQSMRIEEEWKDEFLNIFPAVAPSTLPPDICDGHG